MEHIKDTKEVFQVVREASRLSSVVSIPAKQLLGAVIAGERSSELGRDRWTRP